MEIGGEPSDLGSPRELDQARRVRHRAHVGIGRGQVEMGGKPGKRRAIALHLSNRRSRHELCPQHAEEVDKADQEIADPHVRCRFRQILRHQCLPLWL